MVRSNPIWRAAKCPDGGESVFDLLRERSTSSARDTMQADWRLGAIVPAIGDNVAGPAPAAITPTTSFSAKAGGGVPATGARSRPVTAPNTGLPREGNGTGNDC